MESIVAQRIPYSQIRVMFDAAQKLEEQGRKIIILPMPAYQSCARQFQINSHPNTTWNTILRTRS